MRLPAAGAVLLGLCTFPSTSALAGCPVSPNAPGKLTTDDGYEITYQIKPAETEVGKPFTMALEVCKPDAEPFTGSVRIDAVMPAHRHGMNYTPNIQPTAPGQFQADGFLFHMRGDWQFRFEILDGDIVRRVSADHKQK